MEPPSLEPLPGGWSGETFLATAAEERTVVRVYGEASAWRGRQAPEVDAAVLTLVRGLVPVPRVLEVRRADPDAGLPGLLVTTFEPGARGDLLLPELDDAGLSRVGRSLGRVAGLLACMPLPSGGPFVDADLRIGDFGTESDLDGVLATHAGRLPGWSAAQVGRLGAVVARCGAVLDTVPRRSLVHSDLNPKNVLLDPTTGEVTSVLDWEFAHAGHPATDLGNLVRFDRSPAYVAAVLAGYRERVPPDEAGGDLLERARAADLAALLGLAVRAGQNPVADRAEALLRAIATTGDVHAVPG